MNIDVQKALGPTLRRMERLPNEEAALAVAEMWAQLTQCQAAIARIRVNAMRNMRLGMTMDEVATRLGMSVSRVKQITDGQYKKAPKKKAAKKAAVKKATAKASPVMTELLTRKPPAKKAPAKRAPAKKAAPRKAAPSKRGTK